MPNPLDHRSCFEAIRSRDRRFDGTFFTGVKTTGIYCRPVCPAKTPKSTNCLFFRCAAEAEAEGFRSCLRCRPESSPGTPAWLGTSATVSRGLRLIEEGFLVEHSVEDLAERLGVGARHLSRLFQEHLGTSPLAVEQSRMLLLAKKLLRESTLSITDIAYAVGYGSLRRFHAAFRANYKSPPSEHRRKKPPAGDPMIELSLGYRAPLDWEAMLEFFQPRVVPGVESVAGGIYTRAIQLGKVQGILWVKPDPKRDALLVTLPASLGRSLPEAVSRVRNLFDLGADPTVVQAQLGQDPLLAPCFLRYPGLRVPGCWDRFELAIRAILGQQVTVKGAVTLAGRLVSQFGQPLEGHCSENTPLDADADAALSSSSSSSPLTHFFPQPVDLMDADVASIGMPKTRAKAIRTFARAVHDGTLILDASHGLEATVKDICALPGLGDWTAQYIAMRALREPDAMPFGDLGVRKALANDGKLPTSKEVERMTEAWSPWRAYATMALWKSGTL